MEGLYFNDEVALQFLHVDKIRLYPFSITVADDSFTYHYDMQFSTKDRNHDIHYKEHCAQNH